MFIQAFGITRSIYHQKTEELWRNISFNILFDYYCNLRCTLKVGVENWCEKGKRLKTPLKKHLFLIFEGYLRFCTAIFWRNKRERARFFHSALLSKVADARCITGRCVCVGGCHNCCSCSTTKTRLITSKRAAAWMSTVRAMSPRFKGPKTQQRGLIWNESSTPQPPKCTRRWK